MAEMRPVPCPVCGSTPEVSEFTVNPLFGGGLGYEVWCPTCRVGEDVTYREAVHAVEGWNRWAEGEPEEPW